MTDRKPTSSTGGQKQPRLHQEITPGEWVAECVGSGGTYDNPIDVYEVHNGYRRIAEHILPADAKLMSAAPELLAALERFAKGDYGIESVQIAKSALAKARGEV